VERGEERMQEFETGFGAWALEADVCQLTGRYL